MDLNGIYLHLFATICNRQFDEYTAVTDQREPATVADGTGREWNEPESWNLKGMIYMTDFQLSPIENEGKRVLTTAQLAEAYETDKKVISNNFNRNADRYTEGKHFYCLTGEELKNFCVREIHEYKNLEKIRTLYLWTEKGALLHAKSLNTDKAWEVYDYLVAVSFAMPICNIDVTKSLVLSFQFATLMSQNFSGELRHRTKNRPILQHKFP